MNNRERLKEIIVQLKQIKYDRDLSAQNIHDMVIEAGLYTSMSSVRRVFAEGSENQNFRYQDTIQPIAQVLIGVNEEDEPLNPTEADALKNIALLKDSMIRELERENEALHAKVEQMERSYADARAKIDFLLELNRKKDEQIARKDDYIDRLAKKAGI